MICPPGDRSHELPAFTLISQHKKHRPCLPHLWQSCGAQFLVPSGSQISSGHSPFCHLWHYTDSWSLPTAPFRAEAEVPSIHTCCDEETLCLCKRHQTPHRLELQSCIFPQELALVSGSAMPGLVVAGLETETMPVLCDHQCRAYMHCAHQSFWPHFCVSFCPTYCLH